SVHAPFFFMHGNRDFLAGVATVVDSPGFTAESGAEIVDDPLVLNLYGRDTLITHGDTLCTDDADYQRFRAMVRNPEWQRKFLAEPLEQRKSVIEALRAKSEEAKRV